ncbi:MAG: AAA family ATPase [Myxococcales bacterium]|jgi:predicted kinase
MELAIFVGLQASGKSTFYRERLSSSHALVSKDLMGNVRDKNRRQLELVRAALREGRSVAVDNTNPSPSDRAPLVRLGRELGARVVAYFFDTSVSGCLERNAKRQGGARVPPVAIFAAARRLVPPTLEEGFDALYRVHLQPEGFLVAEAAAPKAAQDEPNP